MTLSALNYCGVLFVHLAALYVVVILWRRAPDVVQRIFLLIAVGALVLYVFADLLAIYGIDDRRGGKEFLGIDARWQVTSVAGAIAHGALLVYFARQWWIKTEACKTLKGSIQ